MKTKVHHYVDKPLLQQFLTQHKALIEDKDLVIHIIGVEADIKNVDIVLEVVQNSFSDTAVLLSQGVQGEPLQIRLCSGFADTDDQIKMRQEMLMQRYTPQNLQKINACLSQSQMAGIDIGTLVSRECKSKQKKDFLAFEQSKHEQLKEMLTMIAHQWRQPLNIINALTMKMMMSRSLEKESIDDLDTSVTSIQDQTKKLSEVIDIFLQPVTCKFDQRGKFSPFDTIQQLYRVLLPVLKLGAIEFENTIAKDIMLKGSKYQFMQLVQYLVTNAKEAFEQLDKKEKYIKISAEKKADKVEIYFENNAGEVPKAIQEKIFNPYFTTNLDEGKAGLGLFFAKELMQNCFSGSIHYTPLEGGSRFILHFSTEPILKDQKNGS